MSLEQKSKPLDKNEEFPGCQYILELSLYKLDDPLIFIFVQLQMRRPLLF